jgi:hypothetical protein
MVAECSSADTGVGATMAPSNQDWKGTWADLVKAAKAMKPSGKRASPPSTGPADISESKMEP